MQSARVENLIFPPGTGGEYGWPIGRGYKKLSPSELKMVDEKLAEYQKRIAIPE